jgi:alanyl-tRNA synthetase
MTVRLYYTDAYLREFDATVASVSQTDEKTLITLDRSAFYPTSGGQPFDAGTLGAFDVVDVFESVDGSVAHAINPAGKQLPASGDTLHGAVDWRRRFEHMQQHTGQHVLSAAFRRAAGAETVSVHLGGESATIDLDKEVTATQIGAAEDEANRVVWDNRPVTISFASAEEAARLPLRKEPARAGAVRIVDVTGCDLSACGGTHVSKTGEIGMIAATSWERFKGGLRVEFVCGVRALRWLRSARDTMAAAGRLLSVGRSQLPASIERLQAEARDHKRTLAAVQTELLTHRAAELAGQAEVLPSGTRLVRHALDGDAQALKTMALAVAGRPGHLAVLISTSRPALAVIARAPDVGVASNEVLASLLSRFGGRGGGKPDIAQGGGLDAPANEILQAAAALIA